MAMIGEQFMVGNEICGMQLSLRYPYDQVFISSSRTNSNGTYRLNLKLKISAIFCLYMFHWNSLSLKSYGKNYKIMQLSVWHRNSGDKYVVKKIGESLRRILHLPQGQGSGPQMDYRFVFFCLYLWLQRDFEQKMYMKVVEQNQGYFSYVYLTLEIALESKILTV